MIKGVSQGGAHRGQKIGRGIAGAPQFCYVSQRHRVYIIHEKKKERERRGSESASGSLGVQMRNIEQGTR